MKYRSTITRSHKLLMEIKKGRIWLCEKRDPHCLPAREKYQMSSHAKDPAGMEYFKMVTSEKGDVGRVSGESQGAHTNLPSSSRSSRRHHLHNPLKGSWLSIKPMSLTCMFDSSWWSHARTCKICRGYDCPQRSGPRRRFHTLSDLHVTNAPTCTRNARDHSICAICDACINHEIRHCFLEIP